MNKKSYQKLNMEIEVLFFASYREKAGVKSYFFEISAGSNLKELIYKIVQKFPKLHSDPTKIVAKSTQLFFLIWRNIFALH